MPRIRAYAKGIFALLVLFVIAQLVSLFVFRTQRMCHYLLTHLESSFGRPVEARSFSMQLLPWPRIDVDGVTIGENPAFGQEYFLRADRMTASIRWLGLLRGHFEFGTISLSRPSLILVRNEQGRWNLEGWLPPAITRYAPQGVAYGPQTPATPTNHLQKIEFDEGRINFKTGNEKRPFAFTDVSGSVEQMAPGRWQLRLEAQPWRSGVALQSTGTLQVRGEVAGTSARLQPAEIQVHWGKVSIADLFRMMTGNDSGVRGEFALDGAASIGKPSPGEQPTGPGSWKFSLHARGSRIHRWDLTERNDNPAFSLNLKGVWDVIAGEAAADSLVLDLPQSRFEGTASLHTAGMSSWKLRINDAGIDANDALAWYRAFQPDVAESVSAKQFFKARFALRGRPFILEEGAISSDGGELRLPGFAKPVRIGKLHGSGGQNDFTSADLFRIEAVPVFFDPSAALALKPTGSNAKADGPMLAMSELDFSLMQNFGISTSGSCRIRGRVSDVARLLQASAAFGKIINHGWELSGGASGEFAPEWRSLFEKATWYGNVSFLKAQLQAAGLNQPLKLDEVHATWSAGKPIVTVTRTDAFGATWAGSIQGLPAAEASALPQWKFQLHADHLDAAELDRWFGPRGRPGWLERLVPSLLGKTDSPAKPSVLLQRISAEGDLTADTLSVEKIKLAHPHAHLVFRDLHLNVTDAAAEWAGGTAHGNLSAVFSVPPQYEASVTVDHADLAQFPWIPHWPDHWSGVAAGKIHFTTSGIGRDALLAQLSGVGEIQIKSLELRGWDVPASLDGGSIHTGVSRWASADGDFTIKDHAVQFDALQLQNSWDGAQLSGSFRFTQDLNLTFAPQPAARRAGFGSERLFRLAGPLDAPVASMQAAPAAQARKQE
jgi:uncharacterized protein involved in outer membrane biogenesis